MKFARNSAIALAIGIIIPACNSSDSPTENQTDSQLVIPSILKNDNLRTDIIDDVFVEIKVNDGVPQIFRQDAADNWSEALQEDWSVTLEDILFNSNNDLDISWHVAVNSTQSTLARASESVFADSNNPSAELTPNYVTDEFDHDSDGISNLNEINAGTFPVTAPQMITLDTPGSVTIGSPTTEIGACDGHCANETQALAVLDSFAISAQEVSFDLYTEFAIDSGRPIPNDMGWGRGNLPVINVSFMEATAYAAWLTEKTGKPFRLPTEAEWEYAARAGTQTAYSTGDTISTEQANFDPRNESPEAPYLGQTVSVDSFAPNAFGLYNVHGNVWEWTCSPYESTYQGGEIQCVTTAESRLIVVRGGSWNFGAIELRSANRGWIDPLNNISNPGREYVGIRVARDVK